MAMTSIFDTTVALYDAARKLMASVARNAGDRSTAIIVSGGVTPKPLFDDIAARPFPVGPGLHIGYSDERYVPETDPLSNYALSMPMLGALKIPHAQVLRVQTQLPLEDAADICHETWYDFIDEGGIPALAFLGLGEDGHTCSIFTAEQLRDCPGDRYAVPVLRDPGPDRVTLTPALLARVAHVVFLVVGQNKAAMVEAMTHNPETVVAAQVVAHCPRVSLWYAPQE